MRKIYDLRADARLVQQIQHATLNTEDYGVLSDHGLFGSDEWWLAVERGDLPVQVVEGVISDAYESGHDDYPEFEVDDGTKKTRWTREGDESAYVIGAPVRIHYVVERPKPRWTTPKHAKMGMDKAEIVLAIWVGTRPEPTGEEAAPAEQPQPSEAPARTYTVFVYDNYHYMDHDEAYRHGDFGTCEKAVAACKQMVDGFLVVNHKPGMAAEYLWDIYTAFGDDPCILSSDDSCRFSAWDYARQRCDEICR